MYVQLEGALCAGPLAGVYINDPGYTRVHANLAPSPLDPLTRSHCWRWRGGGGGGSGGMGAAQTL